VHVEGAFLSADSKPSASSESPTGQALSIIYTPSGAFDLEESGLKLSRPGASSLEYAKAQFGPT
jgi:hypothetical protein